MAKLVHLPATIIGQQTRSIQMSSLDALMPLHLQLREPGIVTHMAPTLRKMIDSNRLLHNSIFDHWEFRRPLGISNWTDLIQCETVPLTMRSDLLPDYSARGILVPMSDNALYILDISLGVGVCGAISKKSLKIKDFSPADPTAEMVYMIEAQAVLLAEANNLIQRLAGKKVRLEEQAFTDSLTGLKNRRALIRFLNRAVSRLNRVDVWLLQLDLDNFKYVNDTYGHAAGDHVLKEVAGMVQAQTRQKDIVARMGGDEFLVAMTGIASPEVLRDVALRIIERLSKPIIFDNDVLRVGVSIGGTKIPVQAEGSVEQAINRADAALYRSKEAGRGGYSYIGPTAGDADVETDVDRSSTFVEVTKD